MFSSHQKGICVVVEVRARGMSLGSDPVDFAWKRHGRTREREMRSRVKGNREGSKKMRDHSI